MVFMKTQYGFEIQAVQKHDSMLKDDFYKRTANVWITEYLPCMMQTKGRFGASDSMKRMLPSGL
jgi:hypothetical protein